MSNPLLPYLISRSAANASSAASPLSEAQRAFVDAAEAAGASSPAQARTLSELPRLTGRELDDLVDTGLVREAADRRYYVFRPRRPVPDAMSSTPSMSGRPRGWYVKLLVFWILVLLVPILFLQIMAR